MSLSGGVAAWNIADVLDAGIRPVTLATDLLKPGGYSRLRQLAGDRGSARGRRGDAPAGVSVPKLRRSRRCRDPRAPVPQGVARLRAGPRRGPPAPLRLLRRPVRRGLPDRPGRARVHPSRGARAGSPKPSPCPRGQPAALHHRATSATTSAWAPAPGRDWEGAVLIRDMKRVVAETGCGAFRAAGLGGRAGAGTGARRDGRGDRRRSRGPRRRLVPRPRRLRGARARARAGAGRRDPPHRAGVPRARRGDREATSRSSRTSACGSLRQHADRRSPSRRRRAVRAGRDRRAVRPRHRHRGRAGCPRVPARVPRRSAAPGARAVRWSWSAPATRRWTPPGRPAAVAGVREVIVLYRRTEREMPASREEYEDARAEGVAFRFLAAPGAHGPTARSRAG